jgi:hypothetical protein
MSTSEKRRLEIAAKKAKLDELRRAKKLREDEKNRERQAR